eukprot:1159619-Pelagomonas_calceolata.AAC.11
MFRMLRKCKDTCRRHEQLNETGLGGAFMGMSLYKMRLGGNGDGGWRVWGGMGGSCYLLSTLLPTGKRTFEQFFKPRTFLYSWQT